MSPHGEETYKDLIYLNDAYKPAIIESQGQEEISLDVENSLNVSSDIQPLKMQKKKVSGGWGTRKARKAALVPFTLISFISTNINKYLHKNCVEMGRILKSATAPF